MVVVVGNHMTCLRREGVPIVVHHIEEPICRVFEAGSASLGTGEFARYTAGWVLKREPKEVVA